MKSNEKNTNIIKIANLDAIRKALMKEKTTTKSQLSEITGISVVTINSLIKGLIDTGEVKEDIIVQPMLGRPALTYKFNAEFSLALIIYMHEKDHKDIAFFTVCNLYGEELIIIEEQIDEVFLYSFDSVIGQLLEKYPQIKVIGFGMPVVELDGRLIICDYPNLINTKFTSYFKEKYKLKVFVENDVNAAVIGYYRKNCSNQIQSIVALYFPSKYPPGAGICINNALVKGKNGLAGEIKYLPFGIKYDYFDYNDKETNQHIITIIKTYMCMFNPDVIVIFKESTAQNFFAEIKLRCFSETEKIMLPNIVVSDEINHYFKEGIKSLALERT